MTLPIASPDTFMFCGGGTHPASGPLLSRGPRALHPSDLVVGSNPDVEWCWREQVAKPGFVVAVLLAARRLLTVFILRPRTGENGSDMPARRSDWYWSSAEKRLTSFTTALTKADTSVAP